jgi:hypothetical protein
MKYQSVTVVAICLQTSIKCSAVGHKIQRRLVVDSIVVVIPSSKFNTSGIKHKQTEVYQNLE